MPWLRIIQRQKR